MVMPNKKGRSELLLPLNNLGLSRLVNASRTEFLGEHHEDRISFAPSYGSHGSGTRRREELERIRCPGRQGHEPSPFYRHRDFARAWSDSYSSNGRLASSSSHRLSRYLVRLNCNHGIYFLQGILRISLLLHAHLARFRLLRLMIVLGADINL
jgi:hypothetical protein